MIHFDLAEVYARRIRRLFRELRDPCPRSDAELMGMAEKVIKEHWAAGRRTRRARGLCRSESS
jgi:hypothetical protein